MAYKNPKRTYSLFPTSVSEVIRIPFKMRSEREREGCSVQERERAILFKT